MWVPISSHTIPQVYFGSETLPLKSISWFFLDEKWRWEIVWSVVVRTSPQPKLKLWSQDDDGSLASNEKSHMNFLLDFPFNDEALEFLRLHTRLENHDNEKTLSSKYTSMGFTRWQAVKIVDEASLSFSPLWTWSQPWPNSRVPIYCHDRANVK